MQIHTLDKTRLISDVQLGDNLSHAVSQGRRSDFALMLALLSGDLTETTPVVTEDEKPVTDSTLRKLFSIPEPTRLVADDVDYQRSEIQADSFHRAGITSARLNQCVTPSALHYPAIGTHGLGEEVYHNLAGHQRRKLDEGSGKASAHNPAALYNQLVTAKRFNEMATNV